MLDVDDCSEVPHKHLSLLHLCWFHFPLCPVSRSDNYSYTFELNKTKINVSTSLIIFSILSENIYNLFLYYAPTK